MVMMIVGVGIVLDAVFLLAMVFVQAHILSKGVLSLPRDIITLGSITFFFVLGVVLTLSGWKSVRRFRAVLQASIAMLLERQYIDIQLLAEACRMKEDQILQNVEKAKIDGYLPPNIEIRHAGGLSL